MVPVVYLNCPTLGCEGTSLLERVDEMQRLLVASHDCIEATLAPVELHTIACVCVCVRARVRVRVLLPVLPARPNSSQAKWHLLSAMNELAQVLSQSNTKNSRD